MRLRTPNRDDPAARGANVGRRRRALESPQVRLREAVQRFNSSRQARTVAGLSRTLGIPWVSIGASAGSPSAVRVTVAWELSWYQWRVDLGEEGRPVFKIGQGNCLDQLDGSARQWNATVREGRIVLARGVRISSADRESVG